MKRKQFIKQLMAVGVQRDSAVCIAEWSALTNRPYVQTLGRVLNTRAWLIGNIYTPENTVNIKGLGRCLRPIPSELPPHIFDALKRQREKVATMDALVRVISATTGGRHYGYTAKVALVDELAGAGGGGHD